MAPLPGPISRLYYLKVSVKRQTFGLEGTFYTQPCSHAGRCILAGALAIPLALPSGEAFPHRDMIIFVTFIIILLTLVGQGLLLPIILKYIDIKEVGATMSEEEQETRILWKLKRIALHTLDKNYSEEVKNILWSITEKCNCRQIWNYWKID